MNFITHSLTHIRNLLMGMCKQQAIAQKSEIRFVTWLVFFIILHSSRFSGLSVVFGCLSSILCITTGKNWLCNKSTREQTLINSCVFFCSSFVFWLLSNLCVFVYLNYVFFWLFWSEYSPFQIFQYQQ